MGMSRFFARAAQLIIFNAKIFQFYFQLFRALFRLCVQVARIGKCRFSIIFGVNDVPG